MAIGELFNIFLEKITSGGDVIGKIEGKSVFVKNGAPDEKALVRVTEEHKNWARAELLEITEKSPVRTEALCPHYGRCGGCNLQHIEYNAQLDAKISILKDSFLKIGGLHPPEIEAFPSPPWGSRNRMQFHCFREKAKNGTDLKFGLKGRHSGEIIAINDCPAADQGIRELLKKGGKDLPLPPDKDRFNVFSFNGLLLSEGGVRRGKINLLEREIITDAGVFFQSNIIMLEKLIQKMLEISADADHSLPMADLYCGAGTFALFLEEFPKFFLAEENKTALALARENLKGRNAEFFALRDNDWPKTVLRRKEPIGFAAADPQRAGFSPKLSSALAQEGPSVLAYVSCDPASLARDSKILTNGSYKLTKLCLFDFYPQTAHIESLALFKK